MSDYTIQELQEMLDNKLTEEAEALQNNPLSTFVDEVNASADLESKSYESEGVIVGFIKKSKSNDKQIAIQRHFINELENSQIVGRSVSYKTYETGSYNDTLTEPTSVANAKATLQAGLDALSSAGDILYIAPGNYRGIFDMDNAVNGSTSLNNKIIGDPDCEQFLGQKKGVIRITNTDENDINAQTSNSSTLGRIFEITKLRTELHNLHVDGGGNA